MTNHTPTPWKLGEPKENNNWIDIPIEEANSPLPQTIAFVRGTTTGLMDWVVSARHVDANASLIVRAVNSHETLIERVRQNNNLIEALKTCISPNDEGEIMQELLRHERANNAALAEAIGAA